MGPAPGWLLVWLFYCLTVWAGEKADDFDFDLGFELPESFLGSLSAAPSLGEGLDVTPKAPDTGPLRPGNPPKAAEEADRMEDTDDEVLIVGGAGPPAPGAGGRQPPAGTRGTNPTFNRQPPDHMGLYNHIATRPPPTGTSTLVLVGNGAGGNSAQQLNLDPSWRLIETMNQLLPVLAQTEYTIKSPQPLPRSNTVLSVKLDLLIKRIVAALDKITCATFTELSDPWKSSPLFRAIYNFSLTFSCHQQRMFEFGTVELLKYVTDLLRVYNELMEHKPMRKIVKCLIELEKLVHGGFSITEIVHVKAPYGSLCMIYQDNLYENLFAMFVFFNPAFRLPPPSAPLTIEMHKKRLWDVFRLAAGITNVDSGPPPNDIDFYIELQLETWLVAVRTNRPPARLAPSLPIPIVPVLPLSVAPTIPTAAPTISTYIVPTLPFTPPATVPASHPASPDFLGSPTSVPHLMERALQATEVYLGLEIGQSVNAPETQARRALECLSYFFTDVTSLSQSSVANLKTFLMVPLLQLQNPGDKLSTVSSWERVCVLAMSLIGKAVISACERDLKVPSGSIRAKVEAAEASCDVTPLLTALNIDPGVTGRQGRIALVHRALITLAAAERGLSIGGEWPAVFPERPGESIGTAKTLPVMEIAILYALLSGKDAFDTPLQTIIDLLASSLQAHNSN